MKKKRLKKWQIVLGVILLLLLISLIGNIGKITGNGTVELPQGTYSGELVRSVPSGVGELVFSTGETYSGDWDKGVPDGNGALYYPGIGTYEGEFKAGKRSGEGSFIWDNGDTYRGGWEDDHISGEGVLERSNGTVIKGEFKTGVFVNGTYRCKTEEGKFTFYYEDKKRTNTVDVSLVSGTTYSGEYAGGEISGKGAMTYPGIGTYEGDFQAGLKQGEGVFTWSDGARYEGMWANDKMDGAGTYYYDAGTTHRLSGQFEDNLPTGDCGYVDRNGRSYITTWETGLCTKVVAR